MRCVAERRRQGEQGMGIFSRGNKQNAASMKLPPDFARKLELYGRFKFDPMGSGIGFGQVMGDDELWMLAQPDPDAFIRSVSAVARPAGGWAVYGGSKAVMESLGHDVQHPDYLAMLDESIEFVLSQGHGTLHLAPYEVKRRVQTHGSMSA
jgi:hypothetical protein